MHLRRLALLMVVSIAAARTAMGQELRGAVTDSASGQPVAGAVLLLLDSAGAVVTRNITNELGRFRVAMPDGVRRVRFLRIGYRPRELTIPASSNGIDQFDVRMAQVPAFLAPVHVVAGANCPRRSDRDAAFSLWEQARDGLLATVVAREANPASLIRLRYERVRDGPSLDDRILRQQVRLDSAERATTSFVAAHAARDFVRQGFVRVSGDTGAFYGPDADALLDEEFAAGYCFRVADRDPRRANQVGLGFAPANRRRGRIDIEGVLWIDTVARALRDIEYAYVGLDDRSTRMVHPGGITSFAEMPNGVVLIDRWSIRMPQAEVDSAGHYRGALFRVQLTVREVGGEIARAAWPDGTVWLAPLGALWLHVVDRDGKPATRLFVRLADTDYGSSTDSVGDVKIRNLLPGPYSVTVLDSALATVGVAFGTPMRLVAQRDSVIHATLSAPSLDEFTTETCGGAPALTVSARPTSGDPAWLLVLVVGKEGQRVTDANWELRRQAGSSWTMLASGHGTGKKGLEHYCWRTTIGDAIQVRVWRDGNAPSVVSHDIVQRSTVLRVELPPR